MTRLKKLINPSFLKWASSKISEKHLKSSKNLFFHTSGTLHTVEIPFLHITRALCTAKPKSESRNINRLTPTSRPKAQAALLDYLYSTRSLPFTDAEYMSRNSPIFLAELLSKMKNEEGIRLSLTKFLRYHPINEFEPFFESLGLKPSEYSLFLPRDLMFLNEDDLLLENFHVLCNYGIARDKIGKVYKEAKDVFSYDYGLMDRKLRAYEELGLSKTSVIKLVSSSPSLLIGNINGDFVKLLEELKGLGFKCDWIGGCLSEKNLYNWSKMLGLLQFLRGMWCSQEEVHRFLSKNPGFLLDSSGKETFLLIGLLLKLDLVMDEIVSFFLEFPQVQVGSFVKNLHYGLMFLVEIEMPAKDIGKIMRSHPEVLGSCSLKKTNSLLSELNVGKKRLCGIIKEDPHQLANWCLGSKLTSLPSAGKDETSLIQKTVFLSNLGFVENSDEMKKAIKVFRGKGSELQERFDCFVKAGLDRDDVLEMIKVAPQVLNQKKEVIEKKLNFLVKILGYPLDSLLAFPAYISYTIERIKLRFSIYNFLRDEGLARPMLALSTVLACSDNVFIKTFVNRHPKGPELWEKSKKALSS